MLALSYVVSAYIQLLVALMALQSDMLNRLPVQLWTAFTIAVTKCHSETSDCRVACSVLNITHVVTEFLALLAH